MGEKKKEREREMDNDGDSDRKNLSQNVLGRHDKVALYSCTECH